MKSKPAGNYNLLHPNSVAIKIAYKARLEMFSIFMEEFAPSKVDSILDIGATSDRDYSTSNYFEVLYPYKASITCCGLDDASFLEKNYPGIIFIQASGLELPFKDQSFDYVHSSAVIEHVGSFKNQSRFIQECARVARKGLCITTPNRWFPVEFHTGLPLIHWLPKQTGRWLFSCLGQKFYSEEANLNLISKSELTAIIHRLPQFKFQFQFYKLLGWKSNLILLGSRQKNGACSNE